MAIDVNIPSQVKNYANLAAFPATGSLKTIFIAEDTNKTYRWTGSAYVEISATAASTWGTITGTLSSQTDLNTALSGKVPTSRTLTINGTTQDLSADRTFTISTGITIGTTAITSGTVGRVLFQGTGSVVSQSTNLFWDLTNNRLGIGTSSPTYPLDVNGMARVQGQFITGGGTPLALTGESFAFQTVVASGAGGSVFGTNGSNPSFIDILSNNNFWHISNRSLGNNDRLGIYNASFTGSTATYTSELFTFHKTGNFSINTTTDAGFKLDVNGTARVSGTGSNSLLLNGDGLSVNAQNHKVVLNATTNGITRLYLTSTFAGANFNTGISLVSGTTSKWSLASYGATSDFTFYNDALTADALFIKGTTNNVILGSTTDVASALLNVTSTTKGFLPPRMTTTQKNAIATPAAGLVVYDSTLNKLCVRTASAWETITSL